MIRLYVMGTLLPLEIEVCYGGNEMIPITRRTQASNTLKFEVYTSVTEDLKSLEGVHDVIETFVHKDRRGNQFIYANSGEGIYVYPYSDNMRDVTPTKINFSCTNMIVHQSGSFELHIVGINKKGKVALVTCEIEKWDWSDEKILFEQCVMDSDNLPIGPMLVKNPSEPTASSYIVAGYDSNSPSGYAVYCASTDPNMGRKAEYIKLPAKSTPLAPVALMIEYTSIWECIFTVFQKHLDTPNHFFYERSDFNIYNNTSKIETINLLRELKHLRFSAAPIESLPSQFKVTLGSRYCTERSGLEIFRGLTERKCVIDEKNIIDYKFSTYESSSGTELHFLLEIKDHPEYSTLYHYIYSADFNLKNYYPIEKNVSVYNFMISRTSVSICYYGKGVSNENELIILEYNPNSKAPTETSIPLARGSGMSRMPCYTTEFLIKDTEFECPVADKEIILYAEDRVTLDTPEGLKTTGPGKNDKIRLKTDSMGKIFFTQYVTGIHSVKIFIESEELTMPDSAIGINQYELAENELRQMDEKSLYDATKTDMFSTDDEVKPLIPEGQRTPAKIEALHQGMTHALAMIEKPNMTPWCKGAYIYNKNNLTACRTVVENGYWMIDNSNNDFIFASLTKEKADEKLAQLQQIYLTDQHSAELSGIFGKIGKFFKAVAKGLVKVVQTVVSGLKVVFEAIVKGAKTFFKFVLESVSDVLNLVGVIFAKVLVFFIDLFLHLILDVRWKDVLRTKRALNATIDNFRKKMPNFFNAHSNAAIEHIKSIDDTIQKNLGKIQEEINGKSLTHMTRAVDDPKAKETASNNVLMRKFEENAGNISFLELKATPELSSVMDEIATTIADTGNMFKDNPAWADIQNFFSSAFEKGITGVFSIKLSDLLRLILNIVKLSISVFCKLIERLVCLISSFIEFVFELVSKKINLPFFSAFYKEISGSDLTLFDVPMLIIAFAATITSKIFDGNVPFKNDAEVDAFINSLDNRNLSKNQEWSTSKNLKLFSVASGSISLLVGAVGDLVSGKLPPEEQINPVALTGVIYGIVSWTCGLVAVLTVTGTNGMNDYDAILFTISICSLFPALLGQVPFKDGVIFSSKDLKRFCSLIIGLFAVVKLVVLTVICTLEKPRAEAIIPEFMYMVRELAEILNVADPKPKHADTALAGTGALMGVGVLICGLVDVFKNYKEPAIA